MKVLRVIVVLFAVTTFLGCPPVIPPQTMQMCTKTTECTTPPTTEWVCDVGALVANVTYTPAGPTLDITLLGQVPVASASYTLIYYPDPWPANGLECLGSATSSAANTIQISSSTAIGKDLPIAGDANPGAKLMLVSSANVDCPNQKMIGWDCSGLFEVSYATDLIGYTYIP